MVAIRIRVRWWYALGVIPLWMAWISLVGWAHTRACITKGLDAELAGSGQALAPFCQGPGWNAPVQGLNWVWPIDWEVGYWLAGTALALVVALVILVASWRP